MASTYSSNLGIELIGSGEQSGTWGTTTNNNLGTLLEQSICGYGTAAVTTGNTTTMTMPNGASGVARNMVISVTGTGGASTFLEVPASKTKLYIIFNGATGAITVKPTGNSGISVPASTKAVLYCDGTNIVDAVNYFSSLTLGAALPVASGGTSLTTLTANNVILGNGTSAPQFVAPTTNGNILTANGTTWVSSAPATNGTVTSVAMSVPTFLSVAGSPVTTSGTLAVTLSGTALPVANGGTGLTAGTSGGVLAYTASGTLASSALLTQYGVVYGGGAGAVPVATAAGTTGQVLTATTSGAPSWAAPATNGTVTSVAAITLGTTGTDLSSTVATGTTTPVITLQVPTASAANRGALSAADWTTFNNKGSGTVTSVTGTAPVVSSGGTTPAISMAAATTSVNGYLTSTDWNTFNNKQAAGSYVTVGGALGTPSSGTLTNCTFPTLNQNTTGNAATATTATTANAVSAGAVDVAGLATAAKPIGASQTWQEFTVGTARSNNVTYTNSSGRPIMVSITAAYGASQTAELNVDGFPVGYVGFLSNPTGFVAATASAIVPAGSTYQFTVVALSGTQRWFELR